MVARDYRDGFDAVRRALERNPGSGFVNFIAGTAQVFGGRSGRRFGPCRTSHGSRSAGSQFLHVSDGRRMGPSVQRSPRQDRGAGRAFGLPLFRSGFDRLGPIPAYVQLDRLPEARAALARFQVLAPGITASKLQQLLPLRAQASLEMVLDGLERRACQTEIVPRRSLPASPVAKTVKPARDIGLDQKLLSQSMLTGSHRAPPPASIVGSTGTGITVPNA